MELLSNALLLLSHYLKPKMYKNRIAQQWPTKTPSRTAYGPASWEMLLLLSDRYCSRVVCVFFYSGGERCNSREPRVWRCNEFLLVQFLALDMITVNLLILTLYNRRGGLYFVFLNTRLLAARFGIMLLRGFHNGCAPTLSPHRNPPLFAAVWRWFGPAHCFGS